MINFMKYKWLYFGISGSLIILSIISLALWQFKPSIDFVGGALLEVKFPEATDLSTEDLTAKISEVEDVDVYSMNYSSDTNSYILRSNTISESKKNEVLAKLESDISKPEEVKFESVGPTLGQELLIKTLVAILIAAAAIMTYVAYQFSDKFFGMAAILAMFHDTLILLGAFSLLGYFSNVEIDTLFVTAVLTTLSFSVHDTIVVFDRIRESMRLAPNAKLADMINKAITETMPRSLNNSMTIIFMLSALVLLGGSTIKWFATALLIGTIAGTYSSTFVAAPLLYLLRGRRRVNR